MSVTAAAATVARGLEDCSLTELMSMYARRTVSPVEVVDALLARIEAIDPSLGAFVTVLADRARAQARASAARWRAGTPLGPLDGVPLAVKDLFDFVPGVPNTFGSPALHHFVPARPSATVERLERAGCVLVGKTAVPELGHALVGPTRAPFGRDCNAGGSSGGSAAAVAARLVPAAVGSDGAGSIRVPAALCGVVGVKPTFGTVPSTGRPNGFRAATPMAQNGPLTRTVADARALLGVLAGPHRRDPFSLPTVDLAATPGRALRVAFSPDLGGFPVEASVVAMAAEAASAFAAYGWPVEPVDVRLPRSHGELTALVRRQVGLMLADLVDSLGVPDDELGPGVAALVDGARPLGALALKADEAVRTAVYDALADVFEHFDVLVTPVTSVLSIPHGSGGPRAVNGEAVDPLLGWALAHPANLTGHPAASVPAGMVDGHPVGLQIIGPRLADADVLAACAVVEAVRPWRDRW